jgi:hypothetical protein
MARLLALILVVVVWLGASACAECDRSEDHCEGNTAVLCSTERPSPELVEQPCGDQFCVERDDLDPPEVFCAPEPEPRPACPAGQDYVRVCDGSERIICRYGYAMVGEDCGDPDLCVAEVYTCLLRPGVEPLCEGDGYCAGSVHVTCVGDYVIGEENCGAEDLCHQGSAASCVLSAEPDTRCYQSSSDGIYYFCAGYLALACVDSYLVQEENCADQGLECRADFCR